ncbi:MAG TPA: ABC transporter permease [Blastocatellia bacterium]|nr:ABC transporter permease [Blastocatellia bacterium]
MTRWQPIILMAHRLNPFESLTHDIRYGLRFFVRNPGFAAIAARTLALGIGANSATFSVVNALMLAHLPIPNPERVITVSRTEDGRPQGFSCAMYGKLRDGLPASVFKDVSAVMEIWRSGVTANLPGGTSEPQDVMVGLASWSFFPALGITPALGRPFTADDDRVAGNNPVAAISYDYWNRKLNHREDVLGSELTLNGTPYTIVTILPPGFSGDWVGRRIDIWMPLAQEPLVYSERPDLLTNPNTQSVRIIARLSPGATMEQARAAAVIACGGAVADLTPALNASWKEYFARSQFGIESYAGGYSPERYEFSRLLVVLFAVVGLVLLIACANLAGLLLARAAPRQREIVLRAALGASSGRIIRQLLTESLVLAAIGGVLGILFAVAGADILVGSLAATSQSPQLGSSHFTLDARLDWHVVGFTAAVCLVTALLFGIAPALSASRTSLTAALGGRGADNTGRRGIIGLGKSLVVLQVAISLLLLVAAGLFVRTLANLKGQDLGFEKRNLLLVWTLPGQKGQKGPELANFYQTVQERVSALPGVISASPSMKGLLREQGYGVRLRMPDQPPDAEQDSVLFDLVAPGFFETTGMKLLTGRDFNRLDNESAPHVAVINESMARVYFNNQNPVGKHFGAAMMGREAPFMETEIVGVVKDARGYNSPRETDSRMLYFPYRQDMALNTHTRLASMCLALRTAGDPAAMKTPVRKELLSIDPGLPIVGMESVDEQLDDAIAQERVIASLAAFFGALAVLLACLGLYGVVSYTVNRRTAEIGIRLALGATRTSVLGAVLKESMILILIGVVFGVPAALAATRLVSTMLFGVGATDATTVAASILLIILVGAAAALLPAVRASRVDPMVALRYE